MGVCGSFLLCNEKGGVGEFRDFTAWCISCPYPRSQPSTSRPTVFLDQSIENRVGEASRGAPGVPTVDLQDPGLHRPLSGGGLAYWLFVGRAALLFLFASVGALSRAHVLQELFFLDVRS